MSLPIPIAVVDEDFHLVGAGRQAGRQAGRHVMPAKEWSMAGRHR